MSRPLALLLLRLSPLLSCTALSCTTEDCPPGTTRNAEGECSSSATGGGGDGVGDGGADGGTGPTLGELELGDPIRTDGSYYDPQALFSEFTGAVVLDPDHALLVGVMGYAVADRDDGSWLLARQGERSTRVDAAGGTAWVITGDRGFYSIDMQDPLSPVPGPLVMGGSGWTYDVAATEAAVAIAWGAEGTWLYDPAAVLSGDSAPLTVLDGDDVTAVDIAGDRMAVVDGETVQLWDIADPAAPTLLQQAALIAGGHDVALSESWLAVGLGGSGAQVFSWSDQGLAASGWFPVPGAATGVALDGEHLWVAAWDVVALARLTADGPLVLGHEDATESAFAIAAEGGRAMVADWFHSTVMRRVDGVAGPELEVTEALYFNPEGESTQRLEVRNYGATALTFTLDAPGGGFSADETTVQVEPGGVQTILVSSDGPEAAVVVGWQSDDPDEASGQVDLVPATSTVGTPHQDFSLQGFSWPDPSLSTFTLPEGEVTFLAYFATF